MDWDNIMEQLLENDDKLAELHHHFGKLTKEQQLYLKNRIHTMKREVLYKSPIHGKFHSEKVCLFAYLLGCNLGLDSVDLQIITDAAMYHDFKRENDFEDSFHGMVSASHIEEILPHEAVYSDTVNLSLLKAIIDYHSQADSRIKTNFWVYDLPEESFERYEKLAKLLKDADALDRKRFSEKCQAALRPEFLRYDYAKELIPLAEEINQAYYQIIGQHQSNDIPLEKEIGCCFHSIGFDFFRIDSVLENGVLSFSEMKKLGLAFPRNFDGGNADRWISVVPSDLIVKNADAFRNFIKNGIVFLCDSQELYHPLDNNRKSEAILKGLPFDKSGYADERYVLSKIDPNEIVSVFMVREHALKDVCELSYLYNSLYYETLAGKVKYLLNKMGISSIEQVPQLILPMENYKKQTEAYQSLDWNQKSQNAHLMNEILSPILEQINEVIAQLMHEYYAIELKKNSNDLITVADVMAYELSKSGHSIQMIDGAEELVFIIDAPQKQKKISTLA